MNAPVSPAGPISSKIYVKIEGPGRYLVYTVHSFLLFSIFGPLIYFDFLLF